MTPVRQIAPAIWTAAEPAPNSIRAFRVYANRFIPPSTSFCFDEPDLERDIKNRAFQPIKRYLNISPIQRAIVGGGNDVP